MTKTAPRPHPRIVVPEGAPHDEWLDGRAEGATASEAYEIARGSMKTWRRIAETKMNGSKFRGTAATRAGHAREAALLDEAAEHLAFAQPNGTLWASVDNDRHRSTPDGRGIDRDGRHVVIEVKRHEHGHKGDKIPADHLGQMQWQMHVDGAEAALYGSEIADEDGMPPVEGATWTIVERDQEYIDWLIYRVDKFLTWFDDGCPAVDDLTPAVAAALAAWAPVKTALISVTAREKAANAALRVELDKLPHAQRFGAVGMGEAGGYQLTVTENVSTDEAAWHEADPVGYTRAQALRIELADLEAAARLAYPLYTRKSTMSFQGAENV
ncbi:YqaJ viral recombinase family protein [Microbacterium saperdae]